MTQSYWIPREMEETVKPNPDNKGLVFDKYFPSELIETKLVDCLITSSDGEVIFKQDHVEAPSSWSDQAVTIAAQKYFYGGQGTSERETSIFGIVQRVVSTICEWGEEDGYFKDKESKDNFYHDLTYILIEQMASFNSPVWFNLGNPYSEPATSACYINSIEDNMESILNLSRIEAMLFKLGSGTGTNISPLRSSKEPISGGGKASGPVSFMKGFDAFAGIIKSGGKCLAPWQLVYTEKGPIPVKELAQLQQFNLWSYHPPSKSFKLKKAKAWKQKEQKNLVRILTNGGSFDVSYDHPMRLQDGTYKNAKELSKEDILFGCGINPDELVPLSTHTVTKIEQKETSDVYAIEVDCPTPDDKSPLSGHTFVLWPNGDIRTWSKGIVVANTRRAAKLLVMNDDHPDIWDFISCKSKEEAKAKVLIENGYDGDFNSEVYSNLFYQNANHSVGLSDKFMEACLNNKTHSTRWVTDPDHIEETFEAKKLLHEIAKHAWETGDPGVIFLDTVNKWNTCKNSGTINSANPCSEFFFLDNSACNLASVNLLKFEKRSDDSSKSDFDFASFEKVVRIMVTAQDILIDHGAYPSKEIALNSNLYRPIGLGYANLGGLLMSMGIPYHSECGREYARKITAYMLTKAYDQSFELGYALGAFPKREENKEPLFDVLDTHACWIEAASLSKWYLADTYKVRNSQVTLLAPTGTIGLMMDCATLGIEPEYSLLKTKKLAGGGTITYLSSTIKDGLKSLNYKEEDIENILEYIRVNGYAHKDLFDKPEHAEVFYTANSPGGTGYIIPYKDHLRMVAAVQPFLSGGISKTINLPENANVVAIEDLFIDAWQMGCKSITVYRDKSKGSQPLNVTKLRAKDEHEEDYEEEFNTLQGWAERQHLPIKRDAIIHKFKIDGVTGYLVVGLYPDGTPGELFVRIAKEGSTISGLLDSWAILVSICLQNGIPLIQLCKKFAHTKFEPSGLSGDNRIGFASSIVDYICRWLALEFLSPDDQYFIGIRKDVAFQEQSEAIVDEVMTKTGDACPRCNNLTMVRSGTCLSCTNCAYSSGCS